MQMPLVDDHHPIQQLWAQRGDHPLADRVGPRWLGWAQQCLDTLGSEHRIECGDEPRVPVTQQELHRGNPVTKVHDQLARSLNGPATGRVGGDPTQVHAARAVVNHDQRVDAPRGQRDHRVDMLEIRGTGLTVLNMGARECAVTERRRI
ncbi:MAG TPA: hypothetical protein VK735_33575 [Pseudonocardia sp.]|uniref:hypothetical protein n=1 Tax=Pseudonocardia sp. TaxID=60912 RepID=UPI002B8B6D90|nr:hypothetical protein [Pseudonocardia sp.]HTF52402.1 hypothetical protein [Pseudonocardia sp.]